MKRQNMFYCEDFKNIDEVKEAIKVSLQFLKWSRNQTEINSYLSEFCANTFSNSLDDNTKKEADINSMVNYIEENKDTITVQGLSHFEDKVQVHKGFIQIMKNLRYNQ